MSKIFPIVLCAMFVFVSRGVQAAEQWQVSPEKSKVDFIIHSTFHEVNGNARELSGRFDQQKNLVINGIVDISVQGLTTDNKKRDQNMYQMFDVSTNKDIHFGFQGVDMGPVVFGRQEMILFPGILTMHNISHPITLQVKARMDGHEIICEGSMRIHLKDYNLKPPGVLGVMLVKDEVDVNYTIDFVETKADQKVNHG